MNEEDECKEELLWNQIVPCQIQILWPFYLFIIDFFMVAKIVKAQINIIIMKWKRDLDSQLIFSN